jgi:6,7-dimethyl-8-ribityllumazine synthase
MKKTFSPTIQLLDPAPRIAIVVSEFNQAVTHKLLQGAQERLRELAVKEETAVWVPGAIEIPLIVQHLAKTKAYEAIIALGAVIRGETTHYDYVCQQVSMGCQQVALEHHIPVIFGVLTTENEQQALDRAGGQQGHKGRDAVNTAFAMIHLLRQL